MVSRISLSSFFTTGCRPGIASSLQSAITLWLSAASGGFLPLVPLGAFFAMGVLRCGCPEKDRGRRVSAASGADPLQHLGRSMSCLLSQDLRHGLALGELVHELVHVADLAHQRV